MPALHPGKLIAPLLLEPSGISQSELARRLGFNQPQPVNELVNGKRGFTPKMAYLFEQVSAGRFPAEFWLTAQALYDSDTVRRGISSSRRSAVDPLILSAAASGLATDAGCGELLSLVSELEKVADEAAAKVGA